MAGRHINDFANEILLMHIFPHLTLKSLIAAQGVCRHWRHLVPISDILPPRKALLELYLDLISSKLFLESRSWTLANLRTFDREQYVDSLLHQFDYLPEAFRLWILEWPARVAIGCCWPGLPYVECTNFMADGVDRIEGFNWLGFMPPQVSALKWEYQETPLLPGQPRPLKLEYLPAILVWASRNEHVWLVLDQRDGKRDKVYTLDRQEDTLIGDDGGDYDLVYSGWVQWQRALWEDIENNAEQSRRRYRYHQRTIGHRYLELPRLPPRIRATPWSARKPLEN